MYYKSYYIAYANKKIEELDTRRQTISKAIAELSVEIISPQQIKKLSYYLDNWGSQRLLRCRSHPAGRCPNSSSLFPPLAAVVAVALFSRFSDLLLRSGCYLSADGKVLLKPEIFGGAVNGRSTKKCV